LSRDRSGNELPPGSLYTLSGRGIESAWGAESSKHTSSHTGPDTPQTITLGTIPFAGQMSVPLAPVLDLTWQAGANPNDLLVFVLEGDDELLTCTFADTEGFGSIPLLTESGEAAALPEQESIVSIHRVRTSRTEPAGEAARARVTFDFGIESRVTFTKP
jgi:hypothetical protein